MRPRHAIPLLPRRHPAWVTSELGRRHRTKRRRAQAWTAPREPLERPDREAIPAVAAYREEGVSSPSTLDTRVRVPPCGTGDSRRTQPRSSRDPHAAHLQLQPAPRQPPSNHRAQRTPRLGFSLCFLLPTATRPTLTSHGVPFLLAHHRHHHFHSRRRPGRPR